MTVSGARAWVASLVPTVALTFDDGPDAAWTPMLLDCSVSSRAGYVLPDRPPGGGPPRVDRADARRRAPRRAALRRARPPQRTRLRVGPPRHPLGAGVTREDRGQAVLWRTPWGDTAPWTRRSPGSAVCDWSAGPPIPTTGGATPPGKCSLPPSPHSTRRDRARPRRPGTGRAARRGGETLDYVRLVAAEASRRGLVLDLPWYEACRRERVGRGEPRGGARRAGSSGRRTGSGGRCRSFPADALRRLERAWRAGLERDGPGFAVPRRQTSWPRPQGGRPGRWLRGPDPRRSSQRRRAIGRSGAAGPARRELPRARRVTSASASGAATPGPARAAARRWRACGRPKSCAASRRSARAPGGLRSRARPGARPRRQGRPVAVWIDLRDPTVKSSRRELVSRRRTAWPRCRTASSSTMPRCWPGSARPGRSPSSPGSGATRCARRRAGRGWPTPRVDERAGGVGRAPGTWERSRSSPPGGYSPPRRRSTRGSSAPPGRWTAASRRPRRVALHAPCAIAEACRGLLDEAARACGSRPVCHRRGPRPRAARPGAVPAPAPTRSGSRPPAGARPHWRSGRDDGR